MLPSVPSQSSLSSLKDIVYIVNSISSDKNFSEKLSELQNVVSSIKQSEQELLIKQESIADTEKKVALLYKEVEEIKEATTKDREKAALLHESAQEFKEKLNLQAKKQSDEINGLRKENKSLLEENTKMKAQLDSMSISLKKKEEAAEKAIADSAMKINKLTQALKG